MNMIGGAWASGGASATACAARGSGAGVRRCRDQYPAPARTRDSTTAKVSTPPLLSIVRKTPQPTRANSTAASAWPSTRPVSSLRSSFSSSSSYGTKSQANP